MDIFIIIIVVVPLILFYITLLFEFTSDKDNFYFDDNKERLRWILLIIAGLIATISLIPLILIVFK